MKKKAYIALPISNTNLEDTKNRALAAKMELSIMGYDVKTPFDLVPDSISDAIYEKEQKLKGIISEQQRQVLQEQVNVLWAKALGKCLEYLVTCDMVYMLTGWPKSKGATVEGLTAELYNIPCYFEPQNSDISIKDLFTSKTLGYVAV